MDFNLVLQENGIAIRDNITEIEKVMLHEEQVECPVYHHFHPGIYMREVHIKKGTFAIGHHQKTRHTTFFFKGKAKFILDDGTVELWEAPMMYIAEPGRKIAYAVEDMVWFNIYPTNETDIETLETTYLDKSDYFQSIKKDPVDRTEDIEDFNKCLNEYGIDPAQFRVECEKESDLMPFPEGISTVGVFDSDIDGKGLFTMATIKKSQLVAPFRMIDKRTPAGRYVNHSMTPNSEVIKNGDYIDLVALKDIKGCHGGYMGEEITIDYRGLLKWQV